MSHSSAWVQGELPGLDHSLDICIDSGADPYSFISKDAAEKGNYIFFKEKTKLKGTYADNTKFNFREYVFTSLKLRFGKSIHEFYTKLYVLDNIPFDIIIGNYDIHNNNLYPLLKEVNTVRFGPARGSTDNLRDDIPLASDLEEDYEENISELVDEDVRFFLAQSDTTSDLSPRDDHMLNLLLEEYDDLFNEEVRATPAKVSPFTIELKDDAKFDKGFQQAPRRQPPAYLLDIKKQIAEFIKLGVIRISSATSWSQIHMAKRKDGKLRFCIDYVRLNKLTKVVYQPLPDIATMIQFLEGKLFFAKLDLSAGFHQIEIEESSRKYTAFRHMFDTYEFVRVPFGVTNAPSHFQRVMTHEILRELVNDVCMVYIDDIIVWGSEEDFLRNLRKVLQRLREHNIILKRSKCLFGVRKINYLGYTLSGTGIELSEDNKKVFSEMVLPTTVTQLRSALGLYSYFRQFLPAFATKASKLYKMCAGSDKRKKLPWDPDKLLAFQQIKESIMDASKLHFISGEGELRLYTDASNYAFGGYLAQMQLDSISGEMREVPICFFSKSFASTQLNWSVSDKECHAIYYGLKYLHHYVADRFVRIFTDHKALAIASDSRLSASPKIQRMKQLIEQYNVEYNYIKGDDNLVADGLSRCLNEDLGAGLEGTRVPDDFDNELEVNMTDLKLMVMAAQGPKLSKDEKLERLQFYHGSLGHWGISNTTRRILDNGDHWHGFRQDVRDYILNCELCIRNKSGAGSEVSIDPFTQSVFSPNQAWAIDVMHWNVDAHGYKYVLIIIDMFHRWLSLYPMKTKTSLEVCQLLWRTFNTDGKPQFIISDLGSNLDTKEVRAILSFLDTNFVTAPTGSHQFNAIAERVIREVREQTAIRLQELQQRGTPQSWSDQIPSIMRMHNIREHGTTGVVPAHIRYGALDHRLGEIGNINNWEQLLQRAREGIEQSDESHFRKAYKVFNQEIPPGTIVYRLNPSYNKQDPLSRKRIGPFRVVADDGHQTLLEDKDKREYRVKRSDLRIHLARKDPLEMDSYS